ncbi:PadR family transcriptional regulator [Actinomadura sp. WAC 06369]|uniref:PadR family transcriptional regulator n=1 Tax=Actinomadura sp. WAC 06369 TaxID=2203193 RepID=UPI000F77DCB3|nr:PadR family transcriptional regulator [Actinomadura sp. WAC 06369]RSN51850.1 PadR family transcriptional regulator [Actinomadura sp. WAC 06369]
MHAHDMGGPDPFQHFEHRARRGGPFGPGGPGGPMGPFGQGGPGPWGHGHRGGGRGGRGGRRTRRGNVRAALLALLAERPMHGYEMIQELDERTGGVWRPSPGSVYPTLQMLEDEGLVTSREDGGKRLFELTDTGRAETAKQTTAPWEEVTDAAGENVLRGREAVGQLMGALQQVMAVGSETQKARALDVVNDARRRIYGILADDPEAE